MIVNMTEKEMEYMEHGHYGYTFKVTETVIRWLKISNKKGKIIDFDKLLNEKKSFTSVTK